MKFSLAAIFIISFLISLGQSQVKYKLESNGGYFYAYATPAKPKGMLILVSDFNQTEEDLLLKTEIPQLAYIHGIVTIVIPSGKKVFADREVVKMLTEVSNKSIEAYGLSNDKVIIGGYGTGGTIALKYAEYCLKYKYDYPISPSAVYTIESWVDIIELYKSLEREIARNLDPRSVVEARIHKNIFDSTLGGGPDKNTENYSSITPFDMLDSDDENLKILKNTPIRLYTDTDMMWNYSNKQKSAYDMPATSASEMILRLKLMGNTEAEMIKTNEETKTITGKKLNTRTSVDEKDLLIWILKQLDIN